jgi:hypothetical protein
MTIKKRASGIRDVTEAVQHLPNKNETLSSNLSIARKKNGLIAVLLRV